VSQEKSGQEDEAQERAVKEAEQPASEEAERRAVEETVEIDAIDPSAPPPGQRPPASENQTETAEAVSAEATPEATEASDDSEPELTPEEERRQTGRKGVKLNRLIASKVLDGNSQRECYLHLVDISEGGLRVNSDDPFPDDRDFSLEIGLAAFGTELATRRPRITFPVRLVWSRSLVGGMVVSGLAFKELDQESHAIVAAIMAGASPQGRRAHFRLNRVLGVELGSAGDERWLYPLTLDLSVEGMRICLSETLEIGAKFPLRIFLEFELPTVQTQAEVMWQEVMPSGRVQIGLRFEGMSERDAMAIKTYIDQCLEQDKSHRAL
jgi:hypothetical protein